MVLDDGVQQIEGRRHGPATSSSMSSGDAAWRSASVSSPSIDRQGVVAPGVEVAELVDAVEDVADELAQEDPRGDAHFAAQPTGHGRGQRGEVGVVDDGPDPARVGGAARVEVPHPGSDLDEPIEVEAG